MKVLKFGGKSLASGENFDKVLDIIKSKAEKERIAVVVSAIGDTTDTLRKILELAKSGGDYHSAFEEFKNRSYHREIDLKTEFKTLEKLFDGISLIGEYSPKIKDQILAVGELISSKVLTRKLINQGLKAVAVDSREFIITDDNYGEANVDEELSNDKSKTVFKSIGKDTIAVVTGFIGANKKGETVTLGRNGSNYSAALLAKFLNAGELQNYTHVDGIFTANPDWVKKARKIEKLNYNEANEIANLGASILHSKTISPLIEKKIPLRVLNTLNPEDEGTLITDEPTQKDVKSLSVNDHAALVCLEGKDFLGKTGIDARIFTALAKAGVSVGVISQGSSERGVGLVVNLEAAETAVEVLRKEFREDLKSGEVSDITVNPDIAVLSIVGQELKDFENPYSALIRNKIVPILFNNTITGRNVSIVVAKSEAKRALNVVHGQIFGVSKNINIAIFGHGIVGGALIRQILKSTENIEKRKKLRLNIFAVGNSKKVLLDADGISSEWEKEIQNSEEKYTVQDVINFARENHLENLIAVDNTGSAEFVKNYIPLVRNGFDLVSSNKIGNTVSYDFYTKLRNELNQNHKEYLYEANVGAGLPLIDTIRILHLSGENITKIKGVFSGSLSYIFNTFSNSEKSFSEILKEAVAAGYTEPDPRDDLSGKDVGRKLLVLARELDLKNEFDEVSIQNLIPDELKNLTVAEFLKNAEVLDPYFEKLKKSLPKGKVLKYVGELSGDLQKEKGILKAQLVEVSEISPLGSLRGSDNLFEIYTESYGDNPIIIQGAGAGADVTARGVFGDILRLSER